MLKEITVKNVPGGNTKKILKSKDINHYHTYNQIYQHAQRHARTILRDAESVVDSLHSRAWIEGYISGITFAIQDLAKFVSDSETHRNNIISTTLETVTLKLKEFFEHEETICRLLGMLAERLNEDRHKISAVTITVPEQVHPHSKKIKDIFFRAGLTAEIKKSPGSAIYVEYAKEIWAYELSQVADNLARAAIDKALGSSELHVECERASIEALANIRNTLNHYLGDA